MDNGPMVVNNPFNPLRRPYFRVGDGGAVALGGRSGVPLDSHEDGLLGPKTHATHLQRQGA